MYLNPRSKHHGFAVARFHSLYILPWTSIRGSDPFDPDLPRRHHLEWLEHGNLIPPEGQKPPRESGDSRPTRANVCPHCGYQSQIDHMRRHIHGVEKKGKTRSSRAKKSGRKDGKSPDEDIKWERKPCKMGGRFVEPIRANTVQIDLE